MSDGDAAEAERREAEMWAAFEAEHQPILLDRALMVRATACELARDAALDRARAAEEENRALREAMAGPDVQQWKQAMRKEYDSLVENQTWDVVQPPKNKNVIGSK